MTPEPCVASVEAKSRTTALLAAAKAIFTGRNNSAAALQSLATKVLVLGLDATRLAARVDTFVRTGGARSEGRFLRFEFKPVVCAFPNTPRALRAGCSRPCHTALEWVGLCSCRNSPCRLPGCAGLSRLSATL